MNTTENTTEIAYGSLVTLPTPPVGMVWGVGWNKRGEAMHRLMPERRNPAESPAIEIARGSEIAALLARGATWDTTIPGIPTHTDAWSLVLRREDYALEIRGRRDGGWYETCPFSDRADPRLGLMVRLKHRGGWIEIGETRTVGATSSYATFYSSTATHWAQRVVLIDAETIQVVDLFLAVELVGEPEAVALAVLFRDSLTPATLPI